MNFFSINKLKIMIDFTDSSILDFKIERVDILYDVIFPDD